MTTHSLTLKEAVYLKSALENPKTKEIYDSLVKNLMQVANISEEEAKAIIFPEFLNTIKSLANRSRSKEP